MPTDSAPPHKMPSRFNCLVATFCLLVSGWAVSSTKAELSTVSLDSYARADAAKFRSYAIIPADTHTAEKLPFMERERAVAAVLDSIGFRHYVISEKPSYPLDLVILLKWLPTTNKVFASNSAVPIYGQTGGGRTDLQATTYTEDGLILTTGSSITQPTLGIVGSRNRRESTTFYFGGIALKAYEAAPFLDNVHREGVEAALKEDYTPVWSINIWCASTTPIDPRTEYSKYLNAAGAYIGKSSEGKKEVPLNPAVHTEN